MLYIIYIHFSLILYIPIDRVNPIETESEKRLMLIFLITIYVYDVTFTVFPQSTSSMFCNPSLRVDGREFRFKFCGLIFFFNGNHSNNIAFSDKIVVFSLEKCLHYLVAEVDIWHKEKLVGGAIKK